MAKDEEKLYLSRVPDRLLEKMGGKLLANNILLIWRRSEMGNVKLIQSKLLQWQKKNSKDDGEVHSINIKDFWGRKFIRYGQ